MPRQGNAGRRRPKPCSPERPRFDKRLGHWSQTAGIENLDVAIDALLVTLLTISLISRWPWTAQFAKRVIPPELWGRPAFHTVNMRITALWAAAFVVCDLLALLGSGPARRYAPIARLIMTAMLMPRIARWYRARLLASTPGEPGHLPANP
jgi:hypothetical protein